VFGSDCRKSTADAELAFVDKALAAAKTDQAGARAEDLKQKAAPKAAEAGTQFDAAKTEATPKLAVAAARKGCRKGGRDKEGRRREGGERSEASARAGLGLHQRRDAEALRAAQHA
jgi:hypothetical protein